MATNALERITAVTKTRHPGKRWSHVALFKEYARRMALWAEALHLSRSDWLLTSIAQQITPNLVLSANEMAELDTYFAEYGIHPPLARVLESSVAWSHVAKSDIVKGYQLPDPYEPMLIFFERGGDFQWHPNGFWAISEAFGVGNVDIETYAIASPFAELDPDELDEIDQLGQASI